MDDDRRDRTLWCGNLDTNITEELLRELFVQAGPVEDVKIPKDNTGRTKGFAFVTFVHAESVGYTLALMDGIALYGRQIRMQRRPQAAVDDTYLDMMNRHYAYMQSLAAPTNMFHHRAEAWRPSFAPPPVGPPTVFQMPIELPLTFPPPSLHAQNRVSLDRGYSRDADLPADDYDRYNGRYRKPDYYERDSREFRDKGQPGMHSKHRGLDGYDRKYQEPRQRRSEDFDRGNSFMKRKRY